MVTTQKVVAVLKKAGFEASRWLRSGRIKGWGHSTPGFSAHRLYDGSIEVVCSLGDYYRPREDIDKVHGERLDAYRAALEAAGLAVKHDGWVLCVLDQPPREKGE